MGAKVKDREELKLARLGVLVLVVGWLFSSGAQERLSSRSCMPYPGVPDYYSWFRATGLASGRSYLTPSARKATLVAAYNKLKLGISRRDAMGKPTGDCEYQWAYILSKNDENMASPTDVAIYLLFSNQDRLRGAFPQNVALNRKGSATQ